MTSHPAPHLKPRKIPTQQRSAVTVNAILEAAAQVLAVNRYEKTTTNHIAERAGVSIGTVYEYFPNKDSLLSALQSNWNDICWEYAQSVQLPDPGASLEEKIHVLIEHWVGIFKLNPSLYSALVNDLPTRGNKWKADKRLDNSVDALSSLLEGHTKQLRIEDVKLAANVLIRGIQGYLDSLISKDPSSVSDTGLPKRIKSLIYQLIIK